MPKMATKAADNVFYKARIEASSWNDRLSSREGAAEETGLDRTRLAYIELNTINPHPEEVVILSDAYNAPELCKIAKRYADTFKERYANGEGLYIEGTNGTGKTHLAAAIALQLLNEGIPVICKTSSDMFMDIKKAYDGGDLSEAQVLNIYKTADLLIIDDLGKEQCSDWSMSTLYSILNDRYEDMKPVIVTTNYGAEDLVRVLTPRGYDNGKIVAIISRLRETSTAITMAWADCRSTQ